MLINEHIRKDGLRQRWYNSKDEAVLVLEAIPIHYRGVYTLDIPLPICNVDPNCWRVDDYPPKEQSRYILGRESYQDFIQCLPCGHKSFNPTDIEQKYCSNCHRFHED